jgi:cytidylate kinase
LQKKINIAIDGFSGCGKSTLAKSLANELDYIYIDSGAMYRAVTYMFLQKGISPDNMSAIDHEMATIDIHFKRKGNSDQLYLNGQQLEDELRSVEVTGQVSLYATISAIRTRLVQIQKEQAIHKGCVMDGRDIGTVVLKDAELKLFLICDLDIRTARRKKELDEKEIFSTFESVKKNFIERDRIDSTRSDSPLIQASDAILLDNSFLSQEELLKKALDLAYLTMAR